MTEPRPWNGRLNLHLRRTPLRNLLLMLGALALLTPSAQADDGPQLEVSGDLRLLASWSERVQRDGSRSDRSLLASRVRAAVQLRSDDSRWQSRLRVAGRFDSEQDGTRMYFRSYAPGRNGAQPGDTTVDEAWLQWSSADKLWTVRAGRFQHATTLPTLLGKALGQSDSANVDVHWTDGLRVHRHIRPGLTAGALLSHMPAEGPGSVHREPLDFSSSGSRVAGSAELRWTGSDGFWMQRRIGIQVLPDAFPTATGGTDTLEMLTVSGLGKLEFPDSDRRLLISAELGYSSNGDAGPSSVAWQTELNLESSSRRHILGAVVGRVPQGWLVSSDFRSNERLFETRYRWRPSSKVSVDLRWRWRQEMASLPRQRVDRDVFLRTTVSF